MIKLEPSLEPVYTARHRYCERCGDGIYWRNSYFTPLGEMCPTCFRQYVTDDLTKRQVDDAMDTLDSFDTETFFDDLAHMSLEDIADLLCIDIYYGE